MPKYNFESKAGPDIFENPLYTNWNIIEKYFWINFLSSLSVKNDLLSLLYWVRFEGHLHWKAHLFPLGRYLVY